MQKNIVIQLHISNATGRNILAGVLKHIKDGDKCSIRIASDVDHFRRLAATASAIIADMSADIETVQTAIASGKTVVLLNDWRLKEHHSNLGHVRTDDGEIGFKAADYLTSAMDKNKQGTRHCWIRLTALTLRYLTPSGMFMIGCVRLSG